MPISPLLAQQFLTKEIFPQVKTIALEYFATGGGEHVAKSDIDLATQADLEIDELLRISIAKKFPESNFLTEETAPKDQDYSELKNVENLWIIDPIDGTVNFSRKIENFAISVALVQKSDVVLGMVYQPVQDDLYWAREDEESSYVNETQLSVSDTFDLKKALIQTDLPWDMEKRIKVINTMKELSQQVRLIEMIGSAVRSQLNVAEGRTDGYFVNGAYPWDYAAASLIARKAGAVFSTPEGEEWDIFHPDVFVTTATLQKKLVEILKK